MRIDPKELQNKLLRIVSERSPFSSQKHLADVENYIEKEFKSYGLTVASDTFSYWGKSYRNIIGRAGSNARSPLIIVGAHLDSVQGTPGADDNASGVAVMLEAARTLAASIFHYREFTIQECKTYLKDRGIPVRMRDSTR